MRPAVDIGSSERRKAGWRMQGQPSPWANAFRGFEDWDDDRKKHVVMQFLQAAGQGMQGAQVVPKPKDDEIQLRGIYAGFPTRVTVDAFWDIVIDAKAPNAQPRSLTVRFDPERQHPNGAPGLMTRKQL